MQRIEQAVLGLGTGNGLLREVREGFAQINARLDQIEDDIGSEREERKQQMGDLWRWGFVTIVGLMGTGAVSAIVAVVTR